MSTKALADFSPLKRATKWKFGGGHAIRIPKAHTTGRVGAGVKKGKEAIEAMDLDEK